MKSIWISYHCGRIELILVTILLVSLFPSCVQEESGLNLQGIYCEKVDSIFNIPFPHIASDLPKKTTLPNNKRPILEGLFSIVYIGKERDSLFFQREIKHASISLENLKKRERDFEGSFERFKHQTKHGIQPYNGQMWEVFIDDNQSFGKEVLESWHSSDFSIMESHPVFIRNISPSILAIPSSRQLEIVSEYFDEKKGAWRPLNEKESYKTCGTDDFQIELASGEFALSSFPKYRTGKIPLKTRLVFRNRKRLIASNTITIWVDEKYLAP